MVQRLYETFVLSVLLRSRRDVDTARADVSLLARCPFALSLFFSLTLIKNVKNVFP